ncbi:MAG: DUF2442 domain-containing protein [Bacteroidota bacterium]|nr:DUF2442 domain-containing protein [Bacteroidota bacterium]
MMKSIAVKEVKYVKDYKLEILFSDNKKTLVDFDKFLSTHSHPQYNKYKKPENFKRFKIENGNVIWGKDWDMIFPVYDLYEGKIN